MGHGGDSLKNISNLFRKQGFHFLLFCLGIILFNWPFLSIAEETHGNFLFIYLFLVWAVIIFLSFSIARSHMSNISDTSDTIEDNQKSIRKEI